jgi:hypothetical protein
MRIAPLVVAAIPFAAHAQTLETPAANNGGSQGWAIYFDLTALSSDLAITGLQTFSTAGAGGDIGFDIYTRPGTHAGFTNSLDGWTLHGSALGVGVGNGSGTVSNLIDIPDVELQQNNVTGIALWFTTSGPRYFGTSGNIQQVYENSDLRLFGGTSKSVPFSTMGSTFTPRIFSGVVHYDVTACYADCDTGTGVGVLDIFDFLCFQNRFDAGAAYACDCDTSTGVGVCDVFDFLCFQNAFAAGCP